jgi:hypothetical protein
MQRMNKLKDPFKQAALWSRVLFEKIFLQLVVKLLTFDGNQRCIIFSLDPVTYPCPASILVYRVLYISFGFSLSH